MASVRPQLPFDPSQLDVREVVRLDRALELRVRLVDLLEDALGLSALGGDSRWLGRGRVDGRQACGHENRRQDGEDRRGLLPARAVRRSPPVHARPVGGPVRHKLGTLAGFSDIGYAYQSQKPTRGAPCVRITNNGANAADLLGCA